MHRRKAGFTATGASLPVGRIGRPCEVAQAAVMAATNGYLGGAVIHVASGHIWSGNSLRRAEPAQPLAVIHAATAAGLPLGLRAEGGRWLPPLTAALQECRP